MVMRVSGLASGMDIDDLVAKMMVAQRAPINRLFQKRQQMEWQRDDLRSINSQILDYRNNKLQPMIFNATYNAQVANVTGNSSVVTAKVGAGAVNGTSLTVSVTEMATSATYVSGDIRNTALNGDFSADASIAELQQLGHMTGLSDGVLHVNGTDVTFTVDDSLNDIIKRINVETNVSAFYDESSGKIAFSAKNTGATNGASGDGAYITLGGQMAALFNGASIAGGTATAAKNAQVTVNGLAIERESNTFSINGIELNLTGVGGAAATIEVKADTDAVVDSIKMFIEDYNTLLTSLQDKLAETRYRDFLPLSDQQRREMKENGDDIEAWDEKAMSGLLRNDPLLTRAVADMRNIMNSIVDTGSDEIKSLASIGIGGMHYTEKGKLHILDEDKLRNAIENNPDAVAKLFNKREGSEPIGIAERLYSTTKVVMDEVTARAGATGNVANTDLLGEQIARLNRQIEDGNQRMLKIENNLYRQFTAMETAIARYASQSAYLMNAFGGPPQ